MGAINTVIENGGSGIKVEVECHLANSLPNIVIVGFASRSIDEAKERIRGALARSRIKLPVKRIIVNLSPADIPKSGSAFDLPILISILKASGQTLYPPSQTTAVFGEVGLEGSVRPVRGIIGKILAGKKLGFTTFWIPAGNLPQARLIPDVKLIPFSHISELFSYLNSPTKVQASIKTTGHDVSLNEAEDHLDFAWISGQDQAKRAMVIAAAGHHHVLLSGPPGTGKTMLARALPGIMPKMSQEEMLEATHLHSLASRDFDRIVTGRPFRAPHHSASVSAVIGGGAAPRPGEISLSSHGVLLLDELPEFNRPVLEALRQPLENRYIDISRGGDSLRMPAKFLMSATANPCPCGNYGSSKKCTCSAYKISSYQKKMSGPILDRIDLYAEVEDVKHRNLLAKNGAGSTNEIRKMVTEARMIQTERSGVLNGLLSLSQLKRSANLDEEAEALLNSAAKKIHLSARGYMRTLKVARTIADLGNSQNIQLQHITEALQYRKS